MCTGPCPYCRTGTVVVSKYVEPISHSGCLGRVKLKRFECDSCGCFVKDSKGLLESYNDSVKMDFIKTINKRRSNVFNIGGAGNDK